ncbi:MAG: hypothetical protein QOH41_2330 [Blastocatellia bacterium]|jgi:hypothetical protein|nr:hypothetical protein [Blastocatellia bacterium]
MNRYNVRTLTAPRIRSDGEQIEFQLIAEDGSELSLAIPTKDVQSLAEVVVRAYQVAKTRGTMLSEADDASQEFEATPLLFAVDRFGVVTQPKEEVGFLIVSPLAGPELHIRFQWPQLRALAEQIQSLDNIQSADQSNILPS